MFCVTIIVIIQPEGQTTDLLTQAMSELTQSFTTESPPQAAAPQQQEYQLNIASGPPGNRATQNIIVHPGLIQNGTTTTFELSPFIHEVATQDEEPTASQQPFAILNSSGQTTITVPLSLATQLITRSFIQSSPTVKIV